MNENNIERYVVTVEFEVFADNTANAVRQYFIDKERFLTVRGVKQESDPNADPSIFQHEQSFYDGDGEPALTEDFRPAA